MDRTMPRPRLHPPRLHIFAAGGAVALLCSASTLLAQSPEVKAPLHHAARVAPAGVNSPGVSHPLAELKKTAEFPVAGSPDWSVVTANDVWVSSARANHVVQLLPTTNTVGLIADVARPCSGLAAAFGSIWVPSCGTGKIVRIDPASGKQTAAIAAEAANSEGGITTGAGSIWFVVKPSKLIRIDPNTNAVIASLDLPSGSENPAFGRGFVWVSSFGHDSLLKVDPATNTVVATIPVGPNPRFLTIGEGSVWTLNQGDGTVSRVEMNSGKLVATIPCGLAGPGGEITYEDGRVWAALFDFPLTEIDSKSNKVVAQWAGNGGDGVRAGLGSVWLSNLRQQTVWRIPRVQ